MTETPECYRIGNGDLYNFSWTSAFWIHNWVSNMVYNRYELMHPDLKKVQDKLEDGFFAQQPLVESKALDLAKTSEQKAVEYLTSYSIESAQNAFIEWKKLGEFLIIKYMDGIVRKEKNGVFERNAYGGPSSPKRVGYSTEFYRRIVNETGDRYKVKN